MALSSRPLPSLSFCTAVVLMAVASFLPRTAQADGHATDPSAPDGGATRPVEPAPPEGEALTMDRAIALARTQGFDVLLAEANARATEGDVRAAGALPNPSISAYFGQVFHYSPEAPGCEGCSRNYYFADLSDQGLVEGLLSRKRALQEATARHALDAARFGRADAERWLVGHVKIQYVQAAAAHASWLFAREVARSLAESVAVNRARYPAIIDEGQLARVEQEALRAEQEVDRARRVYRQEQIDLALLLGLRGPLPELDVDDRVLRFRIPQALVSPDRDVLLREALAHRPDRRRAEAVEAEADARVVLAGRRRIPDLSLHVQYQQAGTGQSAVQPPTLALGVELPLPIFYQEQGAIRRAEADRLAATIARQKLESRVAAEIASAFNELLTARSIVTRYETSLLERARRALDVTRVQFNAGSAAFMDWLDAQRTWVSVNRDYNAELVNYWTAVFSLELAVGKELVP